ncbi:MBL fold metallo-hydrolase [Maritimibacter sp. DP1N21-5]|uniref:MBL fold metallo-hydrolase n=1 Tax=Maritimibacter sp. DP1N21-5 TaxID=2836867 RepID=UPI001C48519E|nr:MBL fold metallo-hydrolase [Maritimibacter sp. DP1N21-5]MBV7408548.1 MBL fold metallo-hydrolase [Maritimibacter sp. DP1N21-5]
MNTEIGRRQMLKGLATIAAAATATGATTARAQTAPSATLPAGNPGWHGFRMGDIDALVLSDGPLAQGDPTKVLQGQPEDVIRETLRNNHLDDQNMTLDQNVLLIRSGDRLALFDTGTGGAPAFGDDPGKLMSNLAQLGIDGASVTDVVLTHAHPDHVWGLSSEDGTANFPNAQVHLHEAEHGFFTDPQNDSHPLLGPFMPTCRTELEAVADRITIFRDGDEVLPGVHAIAAFGHTPGHSCFRLTSGDKSLLLAGDLAHHHVLFTRYPGIKFGFDTDPDQMVQSRTKLFEMLEAERMAFLAYHFPFPGVGHLDRFGDGYQWVAAGLDNTF